MGVDFDTESTLTLKECTSPSDWIGNQSLALEQITNVPDRQRLLVRGVLGKDVLKLLRVEPSFRVVSVGIASVLVFVDVCNVHAEERIGNVAVERGVRKVAVNDEYCQRR